MKRYSSITVSLFFSGFEKFAVIGLKFITAILLARLLTPNDYGVVAMVAIFISLSSILVESGLGGSIVYHNDITRKDYDSVFWVNILISIFLYCILFALSDTISEFYHVDILSIIIKISGLSIIFNSLGLIQNTILYKELKFKQMAIVSIISYVLSSIVAIILAILKYGVWALVAQQVLQSVFRTIILIYINRYKPSFYISFKILKKHWIFAKGLLFSTLIKTIYENIYLQIIGKYFSIKDTGYYSQSSKLNDIPVDFFARTFDNVLFPVFSKIEDDSVFSRELSKVSRLSGFLIIPVMSMISLFSSNIVLLLLGNKWSDSAWILSYMSIGGIFIVFESISRSGIKAKGKGNALLIIELLKRIVDIIVIILFMYFYGLVGIVIAFVINSMWGWLLNVYYLSKFTAYKMKQQIEDVLVFLIPVTIIYLFEYFLLLDASFPAKIIIPISIVMFILLYLVSMKILKNGELSILIQFIKKIFYR